VSAPSPNRRAAPADPAQGLADASPSSREKILDTAEALFARHGYDGTGLREVARRSGLSKSALFHHFPSKLELYAAVLERILGDLCEAVARLPQDDGALARLRAFVEAVVAALAGSPTRAPLLLRALFEGQVLDDARASAESDALLARILGVATGVIEQGVASGELRAVPAAHALQALIGMLVYHFASGELGDELLGAPVYSAAEIRRFQAFVVSFVENGLRAKPNPNPSSGAMS
jgi:AcrR family transcriptional regulator